MLGRDFLVKLPELPVYIIVTALNAATLYVIAARALKLKKSS
jgi:hypothetical protein